MLDVHYFIYLLFSKSCFQSRDVALNQNRSPLLGACNSHNNQCNGILSKWYTSQHRSTFVDQQMLNIVATCWNIVVLVEYSFNFCGSTTIYTFWREVEMADVVMKLSLCALSVVAIIMKRRQKRQKPRKILTREWLRNRTIFGAYYNLLGELRNLDVSSCGNFLRMYVTPFEELLQLSLIQRFLWSFDLTSYRHGKVSYRLIS